MNLALLLLLLRLLSAGLLLSFLALIAWLIYRDLQMTAAVILEKEGKQGSLRVIATESEDTAVGTVYSLAAVTSIGRAADNTIVLDDSYVSNQHALVTLRGGRWWLEDLGSRNGILLNELPLEEAAVITSGDIVTIGGTKLKMEETEGVK
ncbi:MAG: FHA domain-containing protein [Anaerolineae bacterium]